MSLFQRSRTAVLLQFGLSVAPINERWQTKETQLSLYFIFLVCKDGPYRDDLTIAKAL
jgi:hypothetical protein